MSLKKLPQNPTDLKNSINKLRKSGLIQAKTATMMRKAIKKLDQHTYLANIIQGLNLQLI